MMKQRIIPLLLAVFLLLGALPVLPAGAEEATEVAYPVEGGTIYFAPATGTVTRSEGEITKAEIPAQIGGAAVKRIGDTAFIYCDSLQEVALPDGLEEIGSSAFSNTGLQKVVLPDSVKFIGKGCFDRCQEMTEIVFSDGMTRIPDNACSDCILLKSATLPSAVRSIGSQAFCRCGALQDVAFPETISDIGELAFADCASIVSADLPASLTEIGNRAFQNCTALERVTLPDGLQKLDAKAFENCAALRHISIPGGVATIGEEAFYACSALETAEFAEGLNTVEHGAFYACTALQAAELPKSIRTIGGAAFYQCTNLSKLSLGNVEEIGDDAFASCNFTELTIPGTVKSLGEEAFVDCNKLKSVRIEEGLTYIGAGAFAGCGNLRELYLPNTLTDIGDYAFSSTGLQKVVIPASVMQFGRDAFGGCLELRSVGFLGDYPSSWLQAIKSDALHGLELKFALYHVAGAGNWEDQDSFLWDGEHLPLHTYFSDVKIGAWFAEAVEYAANNQLMNGTDTEVFSPQTPMTRGMLVTVLWRYANSPKEGSNTFSDVPSGKYYTDAVAWAAANGIVNGVGDGKFNPDGNITREQLVTILYRYCNKLGIDTSKADDLSAFPDAGSVGNSAKDAMRWAVAEKLIGGKSLDASGTVYLQPKGSATRAEVATILMRFIENSLE